MKFFFAPPTGLSFPSHQQEQQRLDGAAKRQTVEKAAGESGDGEDAHQVSELLKRTHLCPLAPLSQQTDLCRGHDLSSRPLLNSPVCRKLLPSTPTRRPRFV